MKFWDKLKINHNPKSGALDLLKYIGPGLLVTVGFIDPGNWATNLAAGSTFGYALLWVVTFSSVMLIIIQHNVAHLGIVTGLCLAEATTKYIRRPLSVPILGSAMLASISTSLAEILGGAIALQMLFSIPIKAGSVIITIVSIVMLLTNTYSKIERWIITFVSIIGLSFLYELFLVDVSWGEAVKSWVTPTFPDNSLLIIMSVLGAVVMPHNLFLHSEVIQSREWNLEDEKVINKQLKYEFFDTLFSMVIGWAINSAMIILAASAFFSKNIQVEELSQAQDLLTPLVGNSAGVIFAVALLFAGISSTITSGIAGASVFAGFFGEAYSPKDLHTKLGTLLSFIPALLIIFFIGDPFKGLIISQMLLSVQLPITVFTQIYLTSSRKVMGKHVNKLSTTIILLLLGTMVTVLNIALLISLF
ncbi:MULTISPECIES: Nramp family divalent metal transporter [Bacteroidales]|jgi:mn2+ and fe2+ transporter|uniref:Nramp family divalent metal transporter n=1 Tax=Bacteroidales TaxID=171549 RepID=UPI00033748CB|nr:MULTISPECIES: Nramp family divalent metal transporter [Bacteroidales]KHM48961.1 Mg2+/Co2+ transporter [Coprobacter secundus]CCY39117.1 metal ion (Mn2+/Fe2+) transporter (Nramp) family metal ion transporter [Tannerella sp. CAG:118]